LQKAVSGVLSNILLKEISPTLKFFIITNKEAVVKISARKCEMQKKFLIFLAKKTSSIKINKAPQNSVSSGAMIERFMKSLINV
jgi:hypothetical protein